MTVHSLSSLNQEELMQLLSRAGVVMPLARLQETSPPLSVRRITSSRTQKTQVKNEDSIRGLPEQASVIEAQKPAPTEDREPKFQAVMPVISQDLDVPFASRINTFMKQLAKTYNSYIFLADLEGLILSSAGNGDYKSIASHSSVIFHELFNNSIFSAPHKVEAVMIQDHHRTFTVCRADLKDLSYTVILGFSSLEENQINIQTIKTAANEILKAVSPGRTDV